VEEWEYMEETSESPLGDYRLAEYGRYCWELVSHVYDGKRHIYTFKRKKQKKE